VSEELVKRKKEKQGKPIWDHLYSLNREIQEKRDQIHLEKKLQEEEDSMKGCTFQPQIKPASSVSIDISNRQEGDIYERTKNWKLTVDER
jgi:hypothetical protein